MPGRELLPRGFQCSYALPRWQVLQRHRRGEARGVLVVLVGVLLPRNWASYSRGHVYRRVLLQRGRNHRSRRQWRWRGAARQVHTERRQLAARLPLWDVQPEAPAGSVHGVPSGVHMP